MRRTAVQRCVGPGGNGGGLLISTPVDPQPVLSCYTPPTYWPYVYTTTVTLTHCSIERNTAACLSCCGGGVSVSLGGHVTLVDTTVANNTSSQFGGGLQAGELGDSQSTCAITVSHGSVVQDNAAGRGGAQVYSVCHGDVLFADAAVSMTASASQVCRLSTLQRTRLRA